LLHSQKDQWPGCVRQKPKDSLSRTDCALTSTEHKSHQNLLVYFGFRETQNSESHPSRKDFWHVIWDLQGCVDWSCISLGYDTV
jgi:hypothetical protein